MLFWLFCIITLIDSSVWRGQSSVLNPLPFSKYFNEEFLHLRFYFRNLTIIDSFVGEDKLEDIKGGSHKAGVNLKKKTGRAMR